jgi:hypothetical protein
MGARAIAGTRIGDAGSVRRVPATMNAPTTSAAVTAMPAAPQPRMESLVRTTATVARVGLRDG